MIAQPTSPPVKKPRNLTANEAKALLWRKGVLYWKLDKLQREVYHRMEDGFLKNLWGRFFFKWSRRRGKSFVMLLYASEKCLTNKNYRVKYATKSQRMVEDIIVPLMAEIWSDAPDDIKPFYLKSKKRFVFPSTGSTITCAGCDKNNREALRGTGMELGIVDEAGFMDRLSYLIDDILAPQTLTTGGKIIISSTPAETPAHEYTFLSNAAKLKGNYAELDIWTNPRLTKEKLDQYAEEVGGYNSTTWKREYEIQDVTDAKRAVVPQFTKELEERIVKEWPRPTHFDTYEAMDIGFKDLTVVLFAYYDYKNAKTIIEDEVVMNGAAMTTDNLADAIKAKRKSLYTDPIFNKVKEPYSAVMDIDLILQQDLGQKHDIFYVNAEKEDKHTHLNHLILGLKAGEYIIHPRCKTLIAHIKNAIWDKNRKQYERLGLEEYGHFDALDALLYLSRSIDKQKDPYPLNYGMDRHNTFIENMPTKTPHESTKQLARVFGLKLKRRK